MKIIYIYLFFLFIPSYSFADSFDDFLLEVSVASGISEHAARTVVVQTFKIIKQRMENDTATSIPEFGRFYMHEKEKKNQKDTDGFYLSPRTVRIPKFTYATEFRKRAERIE